jgi:predicted DCC family thiol-disulfide oxidoreductase YuxK
MTKNSLQVYFDGDCPLCRREIAFFQRRTKSENITWINVCASEFDAKLVGIGLQDLKQRFHVIKNNTEIFSGGYAFVQLWQATNGLKWLGNLFNNGLLAAVLNKFYNLFLIVRPILQFLVTKLEQRM